MTFTPKLSSVWGFFYAKKKKNTKSTHKKVCKQKLKKLKKPQKLYSNSQWKTEYDKAIPNLFWDQQSEIFEFILSQLFENFHNFTGKIENRIYVPLSATFTDSIVCAAFFFRPRFLKRVYYALLLNWCFC